MKSSCDFATCTTELKFVTTSGTAELTIGLPVAMYSSALVGLMYSVASFNAKGIRQTSKPFVYSGSWAYSRRPSQWTFGRCGKAFGLTLQVGPIIAMCHAELESARRAMRS